MSTYKAVEVWFRLEDQLYSAGVDEFDNSLGPANLRVSIREYRVMKRTPKGVWLTGFLFKRFCLDGARKKFACPTLEGALESFLARKRKQARIYERRVARADEAIILGLQEVEAYGGFPSTKLSSFVVVGR